MPALPDHPNVFAVRHFFEVGDDLNVACRLHYRWSGTAPSNAVCVTFATAIHASMVTNLVPLMAATNSVHAVSVTDLTSPTGAFGEYFHTDNGTSGGSPLDAATAVLFNMHIARRYRGGKPRTYWPLGVAGDLVNPTLWEATSVTAFQTALDQLVDDTIALSSSGTVMGTLCSVSDYHGFTPVTNPITGRTRDVPTVRSVAIAPDDFTALAVNPRPASQRRRNLQG